jgi:hypothetical protein
VSEETPAYTVDDLLATATADQRRAATAEATRAFIARGQMHGAQVAAYWLTLKPHMPIEVAANLTQLYAGTVLRDAATKG